MKRSELEKDANYILESLRKSDYVIPSNKQILKLIFSKLLIVYLMQLLFVCVDIVLNYSDGAYHYFDTVVLMLASNAVFSLFFLMSTYSSVSMFLILGDEVRNKSMLLPIILNKIKFYSLFLIFVNILVGSYLLLVGERFVAGLGFSWLVTFVVSAICLQTSISRYMIPTVVDAVAKIRELTSPGIK